MAELVSAVTLRAASERNDNPGHCRLGVSEWSPEKSGDTALQAAAVIANRVTPHCGIDRCGGIDRSPESGEFLSSSADCYAASDPGSNIIYFHF